MMGKVKRAEHAREPGGWKPAAQTRLNMVPELCGRTPLGKAVTVRPLSCRKRPQVCTRQCGVVPRDNNARPGRLAGTGIIFLEV